MLVRVLWAGRYGRGAVDRSDALAAEVLVRALRHTQVTQVIQTGDAAENNRRQAAENNDSDAND